MSPTIFLHYSTTWKNFSIIPWKLTRTCTIKLQEVKLNIIIMPNMLSRLTVDTCKPNIKTYMCRSVAYPLSGALMERRGAFLIMMALFWRTTSITDGFNLQASPSICTGSDAVVMSLMCWHWAILSPWAFIYSLGWKTHVHVYVHVWNKTHSVTTYLHASMSGYSRPCFNLYTVHWLRS